jgi:hypothetical protein
MVAHGKARLAVSVKSVNDRLINFTTSIYSVFGRGKREKGVK